MEGIQKELIMGKSKSFDDYLNEKLKDPVYAEGYLKTAMADEDPGVFTLALKQVARARGIGMVRLAKMTGLNRESLYKTLSERGNPALATVQKIASAIGFELGVRKMTPTKGWKVSTATDLLAPTDDVVFRLKETTSGKIAKLTNGKTRAKDTVFEKVKPKKKTAKAKRK